MSFRTDYHHDVMVRVFDLILHVVVCLVLPGHWWYQWLPDIMLPYLWIHGMVTDRYLPETAWPVVIHRLLHGREYQLQAIAIAISLVSVSLSLSLAIWPAVVIHWCVHYFIDLATHDRSV